ncbi:hypothetical protein EDC04DRAFT_2610762 [Pisolithus marmoratus]|nr:hypothetical protein EDC04DRAFT_2610762 [Pisolithus marmoratus]
MLVEQLKQGVRVAFPLMVTLEYGWGPLRCSGIGGGGWVVGNQGHRCHTAWGYGRPQQSLVGDVVGHAREWWVVVIATRSATAQRKHAQYAPYAQLHTRKGLDPGKRSGAQSRHAAILQAMAKRCLETVDDAQQHVRHRKRTRSPDIDIPTHEPDLPETDHGPLDDEEVPPTPDLSGPVNEDAFPFIQDRSDAEIDTQLNENFSLHVHDAPNAEIDTQLNENFSLHIHDAPDAEIDTQLNEVKLFSARPRCTRCSPTSSR